MIVNTPISIAASKRVAVLYFEDHSRFDSPTGCGFIPTWPFNKIFGEGKGRAKWHLKDGFRELLNQKLQQTQVYEPVSQAEMMDAMARLGLSKKAIQADDQKRGMLAKALKVDALLVGDIRKFNQERVKANASRTLRESGRGEEQQLRGSFVGGVQVLGYFYRATVQLDVRFYGTAGNEIANPKISASRNHQLGGARVAALEAVVTEEGTEFKLGQTPNQDKKFRPIVDTTALNRIEFGSPEFNLTLFGLTTNEALAKVVSALRESIGPEVIVPETATVQKNEGASSQPASQSDKIEGMLIYVDLNNPEKTYINIGSAKGVAVRQQLTVYTAGEPLVDPSTGDVLGYIPKAVGKVEVVDVQTDRLSRVRVIEGMGVVKKGDTVRYP
jgi:hypothetical protein